MLMVHHNCACVNIDVHVCCPTFSFKIDWYYNSIQRLHNVFAQSIHIGGGIGKFLKDCIIYTNNIDPPPNRVIFKEITLIAQTLQ